MSSGGRGTDCTRCPFMNAKVFYRIRNSSTGRGSGGCHYGYGKEAKAHSTKGRGSEERAMVSQRRFESQLHFQIEFYI